MFPYYGTRRGASLIEILLVIAIIGILFSLIIPAVSRVRMMARRTQNQNNIRQIMMAVHNYASEHEGAIADVGPWFQWDYSPSKCAKKEKMPNGNTVYTLCDEYLEKMEYTPTSIEVTVTSKRARDGYIDGGLMFQLLPHLGYSNEWAKSYGPMEILHRTKEYDNGVYGCPCTKFQDCDGNDNCDPCLEITPCRTPSWVVKQYGLKFASLREFGFQAGRVDGRIKTFMGVGDPTEPDLRMLSALSYPMVYTNAINIESVSTAYTPFLAESYAACGQGGYNSWAASNVYVDNSDKDPIPFERASWPVGAASNTTRGTKRYWTGITGDGTPGSMADKSDAPSSWVSTNIVAQLPNAFKVRGLYAVPVETNVSYSKNAVTASGFHQISPTLVAPESVANFDCAKTQSDAPECHLGEWYYDVDFIIKNPHAIFYDVPTDCSTGFYGHTSQFNSVSTQPGTMHSLTPGSLNVGMLDGSIKTLSMDTDRGVWNAFVQGRSPASDW